MDIHVHDWDSFDVTISEVVSIVGCFCVLSLFEQYRLASKDSHFSSPFLPKTVLLVLTAFCIGAVCMSGTHILTFAGGLLFASAQNQIVDVGYKSNFITMAVIVPCLLCFTGLLVCSCNNIYVKDEFDTINDYINDTRTKNIKDIRAMKHKTQVLKDSLLAGIPSIIIGGLFVGSGMISSQYLTFYALEHETLELNPGFVVGDVILSCVYGVSITWTLFRLLSLFPFDETKRSISCIVLVVIETACRIVSVKSVKYSVAVERPHHALFRDDLEPYTLSIISFVVMGLFTIILTDMRVCYNSMNDVIASTDEALRKMKLNFSQSSRDQFADEYSDIRKSDHHKHPRKRRTPQKEGNNESPSKASVGTGTDGSPARVNSSPEGRTGHIMIDFADCNASSDDENGSTHRSRTNTDCHYTYGSYYNNSNVNSKYLSCPDSSKTVSTVTISDYGFSNKSGFDTDRSLRDKSVRSIQFAGNVSDRHNQGASTRSIHRMTHLDSKMSNSTNSSQYSRSSRSTAPTVGSESSMSLGLGLEEFPYVEKFTKVEDETTPRPRDDDIEGGVFTNQGWFSGSQLTQMFKHSLGQHDVRDYIVTNMHGGEAGPGGVAASPRANPGSPSSNHESNSGSPSAGSPSIARKKSIKYSVAPNLQCIDETSAEANADSI